MSSKIEKIKRNISKMLNFSPDLLIKDITITIYGAFQANISGCKKILVYDDSMLVVSNTEKQLKVLGSNLVLSEMSEDEIILRGDIKKVEFENGRR